MYKTAVTHVNTGVGALITFAKDNQITRSYLMKGEGEAPFFEFSHCAGCLKLSTFLVDVCNQSAAVET